MYVCVRVSAIHFCIFQWIFSTRAQLVRSLIFGRIISKWCTNIRGTANCMDNIISTISTHLHVAHVCVRECV
jgi:hypothetical protein